MLAMSVGELDCSVNGKLSIVLDNTSVDDTSTILVGKDEYINGDIVVTVDDCSNILCVLTDDDSISVVEETVDTVSDDKSSVVNMFVVFVTMSSVPDKLADTSAFEDVWLTSDSDNVDFSSEYSDAK